MTSFKKKNLKTRKHRAGELPVNLALVAAVRSAAATSHVSAQAAVTSCALAKARAVMTAVSPVAVWAVVTAETAARVKRYASTWRTERIEPSTPVSASARLINPSIWASDKGASMRARS